MPLLWLLHYKGRIWVVSQLGSEQPPNLHLYNWTFCLITPFKVVRIENSFTKWGNFYKTIILSTNNPMLSSKLNILLHNSIPSIQIWKIPSQTCIAFFKMIILSTNNPMLSSKLNVLSHNSITRVFSRQWFWIPMLPYVIFKIKHFVP